MESAEEQIFDKRVLIDLDRCTECGSCAAACYYSHANMPVVRFARAGWALLPVICRQCKGPSCVDACPVEAMVRDERGAVRRRLFRCIGCSSCAKACPFGIIPSELAGVPVGVRSLEGLSGHQVAKCDLCEDRLVGDPEAVPRCVAACPSGALTFVDERQAPAAGLAILGGRATASNPYKRR